MDIFAFFGGEVITQQVMVVGVVPAQTSPPTPSPSRERGLGIR